MTCNGIHGNEVMFAITTFNKLISQLFSRFIPPDVIDGEGIFGELAVRFFTGGSIDTEKVRFCPIDLVTWFIVANRVGFGLELVFGRRFYKRYSAVLSGFSVSDIEVSGCGIPDRCPLVMSFGVGCSEGRVAASVLAVVLGFEKNSTIFYERSPFAIGGCF